MFEVFPLVTVGVANYNNSLFVIQTLESIRNQNYPNIELVIVDDGSSDDSPQLIIDWLKGFNKPFKYIVHEKNCGLCKTCNDIVSNSNGKYISFIGTDDLYLPEKVSSQVEIMEAVDSSVAMVYTDTFLIDDNGDRIAGSLMTTFNKIPFDYIPTGNVLHELQHLNFIHGLSILIKRSVFSEIGLYDEALSFEDYDMSLRIAKKYQILYSEKVQCLYRIHNQSFSGKTKNWEELLMPVYTKHAELPLFNEKAKSIIWRNYLEKNPKAKKWAKDYYKATKEKFQHHFFVINNIPLLFFRIYRKLSSFYSAQL